MEYDIQNTQTDQSVEFSKKSEARLKKSYIVGYSIFDIHWEFLGSISFNPKNQMLAGRL